MYHKKISCLVHLYYEYRINLTQQLSEEVAIYFYFKSTINSFLYIDRDNSIDNNNSLEKRISLLS